MNKKCLTISLMFMGILLSACGPRRVGLSIAEVTGPQAWFDAPLPDSACYPPTPCQVVVHGSDPGGLTQFELDVNGKVQATIPSPDTQASLVTLSQNWTPPGPGTYQLQIRAQNKSGKWSNYASTTVIVGAEGATTVATASPTPTQTPTPATNGNISIVGVSTNVVYYRGSCSPKDVTVQVKVLNPTGVKVVVLFYRVKSNDGSKVTDFNSKSMNPQGDNLYQTTVNPEGEFGGSTLSGIGEGVLELQAVIQTDSGDTSVRTTVLPGAMVATCGSGGASGSPTLIFPPPMSIITPTPVIIR